MNDHHQTAYDMAFVIVTFNSEGYIRRCIESIRACRSDHWGDTKIIVIDNASSDGTTEILASMQKTTDELHVVFLDHNVGFGPANNVAFKSIRARYYVLLNHDAWLIGDSISPALAALDNAGDIAVCGLPLVFPDGSPQTYAYPFSSWKKWLLQLLYVREFVKKLIRVPAFRNILAQLPYGRDYVRSQSSRCLDLGDIKPSEFSAAIHDVAWVCGAAMIINGGFVRQIGGFDPALFMYGEDEDLCIAAHRKGRRVTAIDTIPVVHVFGWGKNAFNRKVAAIKYRSLRYFIRKNIQRPLDRLLMACLLPFHVYGVRRFFLAFLTKG